MQVPISKRARQYGYVIWTKAVDQALEDLLGETPKIAVTFSSEDLGTKRVDWKYRRISVGRSRTARIDSDASTFVLSRPEAGRLVVALM